LKASGDFVTASNGWGFVNMLGFSVNDSIIGLCGLLSSSIGSYEAYQKCWRSKI